MQIFKMAAVGAAVVTVGMTSNEAFAARKTRVQLTCEQIQKNGQNETLENTLPIYSEHFYIVAKFNSCLNTLLTPPYTYLRTSGTGSGLVSRNKEGTQVVLARFPSSGDLSSFGLTTSVIKTLAIPNNIQEWPTSALSGCTNLEKISVYGEESDEGSISINCDGHRLRDFSKLTSIQLPSTVTLLDYGSFGDRMPLFPFVLKSIVFPRRLTRINNAAFCYCDLRFVNFSKCIHLELFETHVFNQCSQLKSVDLSACVTLREMKNSSFSSSSLMTIVFPSSDFKTSNNVFGGAPIKTIIWKGRTTRPSGLDPYTFGPKTLDTLISEGTITEIFVP